jgi:hypothetical protein
MLAKSENTNKTRNIKKRIFAISSDMPSTVENPKNPAIIARIKKVITNRNIQILPLRKINKTWIRTYHKNKPQK